ncbi:hypothetical protein [Pedobacter alluvionis]|nr:hypothetical protein [Pedobacter alluvionis]TFB33430.1 hypothetical protein E3V97_05125 [Pedobacter alluvionis]
MLFEKTLNEKHIAIWPQFEKLYHLVLKNQTHDGDLLLVHINGYYDPKVHTWDNIKEKLSPYMFGRNNDGFAEHTHYDFIGHYIKENTWDEDPEEYLKKFIFSEERRNEIEELEFKEAISIQTEMLIYIKIWESDTFIKKFSQLTSLLSGESYDWHLNLSGIGKKAFTSRSIFIKDRIIKRLQNLIPDLHSTFEKSYLTQIRNAIAHSQYSILGRRIQLNNFKKDSLSSNLRGLTMDEWSDIFHETIVLYTCYHKFLRLVNANYGTVAKQNSGWFPIRITRKDPIEETQYLPIYYGDFFEKWNWQPEQ